MKNYMEVYNNNNLEKPVIMKEVNNTPITRGCNLKSKKHFSLWGTAKNPFQFSKTSFLFLLGMPTNKLNTYLSMTYNKLNYICVCLCVYTVQKTKFVMDHNNKTKSIVYPFVVVYKRIVQLLYFGLDSVKSLSMAQNQRFNTLGYSWNNTKQMIFSAFFGVFGLFSVWEVIPKTII